MTKKEFIEKWNNAYENHEQKIEFTHEMRADLDKIKPDHDPQLEALLKDLENLITERISDLHNVKGGMQARHAYMFYRERVYEALGHFTT